MRLSLSFGWRALAIATVALVVVLVGVREGAEYYTSQSSFCGGSCHIMDEPNQSWIDSKHYALDGSAEKRAECIECHFLPGEKRSFKAMMEGARHLAAYLYDRDAHMPIRPVVKDGACLRSGCHSTDKFEDKTLKLGETSVFTHKAHFEKEVLKGQKLFCDTCHVKHSAEKHFEVPNEICFTCHLRPESPQVGEQATGQPSQIKIGFDFGAVVKFEERANKCSLCHTVPTKSLQEQFTADDPSKKPITHQTLERAGVPCESCHLHQVVGRDEIKTDECLDCHSASSTLWSKGKDARLMHDKHVAGRRADCLECHQPSEHGKGRDYLDSVRSDCVQCHRDQHRFQKILLAGERVSENVSPVPGLMHAVQTNCAGCHIETKHKDGQIFVTGSGKTCVKCHTPEHHKMLDDWKKTLDSELEFVREVETEALEALTAAAGKFDAAKLKEAEETLTAGQELLNIVEIGNGVHNKKYSIMILDEAITNFEDAIDLLDTSD
ncbi:MAG: cytochrome c3 family protein [Alphaproteobacteria bacterium]|nr:cytochrome c3 family protein [Alphaproteobacteria bacterium]